MTSWGVIAIWVGITFLWAVWDYRKNLRAKRGSKTQPYLPSQVGQSVSPTQPSERLRGIAAPISQPQVQDIDGTLAALLRESTAHKDAGDWPAAVACLYKAKALMLKSPMNHTAESWCKLPLYLQQAGMYNESMAEFQFLLADLDRRARRDARLDDPNVGPEKGKREAYEGILEHHAQTIEEKRALAQKREEKRTSKLVTTHTADTAVAKPRKRAVKKGSAAMASLQVPAQDVFDGLYLWMQANPWFLKIDIQTADLTQEAGAQQAVLAMDGDRAVFDRLPLGVQGLAARFIVEFMAVLRTTMLDRVWQVSPPQGVPLGLDRLAWLVIAQEIDLAFPPPTKPH